MFEIGNKTLNTTEVVFEVGKEKISAQVVWEPGRIESMGPYRGLCSHNIDLRAPKYWEPLVEAFRKKRIRQTRDALNKCKSLEKIEEIATLLNI